MNRLCQGKRPPKSERTSRPVYTRMPRHYRHAAALRGASAVHAAHALRRVALAGSCAHGSGSFQPAQVVGGEPDRQSRGILLQVLAALGPWDGDDVVAAREDPGQRQLRRRDLLLARDGLDARDQLQISGEVLALEARIVAPPVV